MPDTTKSNALVVSQEVLDELAELVEEFGVDQRSLDGIKAVEEAEIAAAKKKSKKDSMKPARRQRKRMRRFHELDVAYGDELFSDLQHLALPSGQFGRQMTTEVKVTGKVESVAKRLLRMGRRDLVREIYLLEVDKQAVKKPSNLPFVAKTRGMRIDIFRHIWIKPAGRKERINGSKKKIGVRRNR